METKTKISKEQLESLKKAITAGMNGAATALTEMIGKEINVTTPMVDLVVINDVSDLIGGPETGVVGIYISTEGDINGHIILLLHLKSAYHLVDLLMEKAKGETVALDEMDRSALEEVGNIAASFFMKTLGDYTSLEMVPSPPCLGVDMASALLSSVLVDVSKAAEQVLIMETIFSISSEYVRGFFFLFPDSESLEKLLTKIREL